MNEIASLAQLLDGFPDLAGGKVEGPEPAKATELIERILRGGRDAIARIAASIHEVDDGSDYKSRYAIHALAAYAGSPDRARQRELFSEALLSVIEAEHPVSVKAFLIEELRWAGGPAVVERLARFLDHDALYEPAARALVAIREGAAPRLLDALPRAKGPQRLAIVQALGVLAGAESLSALREAARDEHQETRLAALWGLANAGDAGSADRLLEQAAEESGWPRIQAAKACLLLAEKLLAAGRTKESAEVYRRIRDAASDPAEAYVRDAAARGLEAGA